MVENSARRRSCDGGLVPPLVAGTVLDRLRTVDDAGVGAGVDDGEPKKRRVDEMSREGSRRVDKI